MFNCKHRSPYLIMQAIAKSLAPLGGHDLPLFRLKLHNDTSKFGSVFSYNSHSPCSDLELPSQDGIYLVMEGESFDVCCPRTGKFSIGVMVSGSSKGIHGMSEFCIMLGYTFLCSE